MATLFVAHQMIPRAMSVIGLVLLAMGISAPGVRHTVAAQGVPAEPSASSAPIFIPDVVADPGPAPDASPAGIATLGRVTSEKTVTTAACGPLHPSGDFIESLNGRAYRLHVPASASDGSLMPLVVNFHGYARTAADQELYSQLVPLADREGFVLVTPEGSGQPQGWDIVGIYDENGVDDVAFTAALVSQIESELCVDTNRIYATGISNGAEMAAQVACDLPTIFAAVAPVAGVVYQDCSTSVPLIAFNGTADENVPIAWAFPALAGWAATNGCSYTIEVQAVSDHVEHRTYTGCGLDSVEFYVIGGGGHTWPGAADNAGGVGPTTHEISAGELMWQFFQAHPRGSETGTVSIPAS